MDFTLLDHLLNPVVAVDEKYNLVYFNHICSSYFKLPPRKIKKTGHIGELLIIDQESLQTYLSAAVSEKISVVTHELALKLPEDATKVMTVILKFIPLDGFILIHLTDFSIEKQLHEKYKEQIQELRDTHEQIVRSDRLTALGEVTAGIGHEIANPLTIISDRLLRLEEDLSKKNVDSASENLEEINSGFKRISKIITNMQSFIKDEEDELTIISLADVINDAAKFVKELDIFVGITLKINIKEDVLIMGDAIKMQQVLINLLKNAIQEMNSAGTENPEIGIDLFGNHDEQVAILKVQDNGPGVAKNIKENIFNMFFTTKEIGEGTGLGLSITQKIIASFNGQINLLDTDVGACFEIQIPLSEISTYTVTNKYFNGEKELEDPKVIVLGDNAEVLGKMLITLKEEDFVLIFTNRYDDIDSLEEFYGPFKILYFGRALDKSKHGDLLRDISDLVLTKALTKKELLARING